MTWLPRYVVERAGPSPGRVRVRITAERTGLNFTKPGEEYDAEVCPEDSKAVWITRDGTTGFRLTPDQFERVAVRRARSLDAFFGGN